MKSASYSTIGVQLVSWALLAAIAVMTLGPIGLRPQTHFSPDLERLAAYVVLGMSFALSYPQRRLWLLGVFLIAAAVVLEIGQSLVPSRDPHLTDFLFKAGGAVIGLVSLRIAYLAVLLRGCRFVAVPWAKRLGGQPGASNGLAMLAVVSPGNQVRSTRST